MPTQSPTLDEFFANVEKHAFRMARFVTRDREEALDIVQDAMFGFVGKYAGRPAEERRPLFYRILQNRMRDWIRRTKVRNRFRDWFGRLKPARNDRREDDPSDPVSEMPDRKTPGPEDRAVLADSMTALDHALRTLPHRQRQAFLLRAWEDMSVEETAAAMGCSEGSVKTHYSRAVHRLREMLEDHWP